MKTPLLRHLLVLAVLLFSVLAISPAAVAGDRMPSQREWRADVRQAMKGSGKYVTARVESGDPMLGINFDIDNTSMATHYAEGKPIKRVLRFAQRAHAKGVYLLFNTGRTQAKLGDMEQQLIDAGYAVTEICTRDEGERLARSKQECRQHFVDEGYTIIANVGNRRTDFVGGNYERAFRLPNYRNRLG